MADEPVLLTEQQQSFFKTFGFIHLKGILDEVRPTIRPPHSPPHCPAPHSPHPAPHRRRLTAALTLPARQEIGWIQEEFEAAWESHEEQWGTPHSHDGSARTIWPGCFVTSTPRLSTLIENPKIRGICLGTLGEGYTLEGGDGKFYSGDTGWCVRRAPPPPFRQRFSPPRNLMQA